MRYYHILKYVKLSYVEQEETGYVRLTKDGYEIVISSRLGKYTDDIIRHEVSHILRGDLVAPQMNENSVAWNIACDAYINDDIQSTARELGLITHSYIQDHYQLHYNPSKTTAVQLYDMLKTKCTNNQRQDMHNAGNGGNGSGNGGSSNGGSNGSSNGSSNGGSNGSSNGSSNGGSNGSSNGNGAGGMAKITLMIRECTEDEARRIHQKLMTLLDLADAGLVLSQLTVQNIIKSITMTGDREVETYRRIRGYSADGYISVGTIMDNAPCRLVFIDVSGSCSRYHHIAKEISRQCRGKARVFVFGSSVVEVFPGTNIEKIVEQISGDTLYHPVRNVIRKLKPETKPILFGDGIFRDQFNHNDVVFVHYNLLEI